MKIWTIIWIVVVALLIIAYIVDYRMRKRPSPGGLGVLSILDKCQRDIRRAGKMLTKKDKEIDSLSKYGQITLICPYDKENPMLIGGGSYIKYLKQMGWEEQLGL